MSKTTNLTILAAAVIFLTLGLAGCKKTDTPDASAQTTAAQPEAAQADNLAPTDATQQTSVNDQQQPAPTRQVSRNSNDDSDYDNQDSSYGQPVLQAQEPPPPLPEYSQPECPGDGYLWTPGYWSYAPQGYYWVPGAWVQPPEVGYLWTPGYWGFYGGRYRYNYGSWGQYVGYYGGINYGFGYVGTGYQGGYWSGRRFNYNRNVNNVNITNINVYNRTVTNTSNSRASYNGAGGITRRPLPAETAAMHAQRIPPMNTQLQHQHEAAQNHQQFASANQGRPAILAATKPIAVGKPIAPVIPARVSPQPQQQHAQAPQQQQHAQTPQQQQHAQAPQQQQHAQAPQQQQHAQAPQQQQHAQAPQAPQQQQHAKPQPQHAQAPPQQQHAQPQPQQHAQPQAQQHAQPQPQQHAMAQPQQHAQAQPQQHTQAQPQQHTQQRPAPEEKEKDKEKK